MRCVLHRRADGKAAVLHLGWQDTLLDAWQWPRLWAAPEVEPERLFSVAGFCRQIWTRFQSSRQFPYALHYVACTFDASGQLVLGEGGRGLTCATFVLAVFNAVGVKIVDEGSWPVRREEDLRFVDSVRGFARQEHLAVLEKEARDGCTRIQPQEVVGACACALPANFTDSSRAGECVLSALGQRPAGTDRAPNDAGPAPGAPGCGTAGEGGVDER